MQFEPKINLGQVVSFLVGTAAAAGVAWLAFDDVKDRIRDLEQKEPALDYEALAQQLASGHAELLRGIPGKDGKSATSTEVADELFRKYRNELVGPPGPQGEAASVVPVENIVNSLIENHSDQLASYALEEAEGPDPSDEISALQQEVLSLRQTVSSLRDEYADEISRLEDKVSNLDAEISSSASVVGSFTVKFAEAIQKKVLRTDEQVQYKIVGVQHSDEKPEIIIRQIIQNTTKNRIRLVYLGASAEAFDDLGQVYWPSAVEGIGHCGESFGYNGCFDRASILEPGEEILVIYKFLPRELFSTRSRLIDPPPEVSTTTGTSMTIRSQSRLYLTERDREFEVRSIGMQSFPLMLQ